MTATTTFTLSHPTIDTAPATRPVPARRLGKTGVTSGLAASVATASVAAVAHAAGLSLSVSGKAIPLLGFAQLTFVAALIGTAIAAALSRRAVRPRRTFVITTLALTAASIVPDVLADAHTTTRLTLALTHVVAAAIVIPALTSRLAD